MTETRSLSTEPGWLSAEERDAWLRLITVVELLPGVLDTQLQRDSGLTHFEYIALSVISEADARTLRMSTLASRTNSTLPRLSHVVARLEKRGLVERFPCTEDKRATNVRLTAVGWSEVVAAAGGHVATVRENVFDQLAPGDVAHLTRIATAISARLDPAGVFTVPTEAT